ncbi:MAG TPA: 2,4-diaminopentanoate dehydrogenase [Synergistaceae bacterium]|nr:2,4-diaminopentanoate dehydrogenase [Synergistaceae bacterium]HPQ37738.1 2,4-diaminopentanoate dehydrogenase [Synergistaceae bacterium]
MQSKKIKVIVVGLGAMGSGIARLLLEKEAVQVVGAVASRREKQGKDLAEVLDLPKKTGVLVSSLEEALSRDADVVIQCTTSFLSEAAPAIIRMAEAGKNVISIAEEMSYPRVTDPHLTSLMEDAAKKAGVTILGTGVNPGFVLDTLVLTLTGSCEDVLSLKASRINDLSPFGHGVMKTQGVGTTPEEFRKGLEEGRITGHIGFIQSLHMIADALGWELDEVVETREPIISKVSRKTPHVSVEPGMVAGCNHTARGMRRGVPLISLEHPQQIHPHLEGVETGDYIEIQGSSSSVSMAIKPEIPGGIGTISMAVNMIPQVLRAAPGLVTMLDLPFPRAFGASGK